MENKEVITIIEKENLINCQINIDKQKENNYNITNQQIKFLKDNNKTAQFTHNPAKERVLIINLKK